MMKERATGATEAIAALLHSSLEKIDIYREQDIDKRKSIFRRVFTMRKIIGDTLLDALEIFLDTLDSSKSLDERLDDLFDIFLKNLINLYFQLNGDILNNYKEIFSLEEREDGE